MRRGRVLLLEDDLALRGLLTEAFSGEGLDVRACETFAEVRSAALEQGGDLVVADFWGASQQTLADDERQEIVDLCALLAVVLLTGRTWAAQVSAEELGARALIRKPFDLDDLLHIVEHTIDLPQA